MLRREQYTSLRHLSSSALRTAFGRCCSGSSFAARLAALAVSVEPWAPLDEATRVLGDTCDGSSDQGGGWTCFLAKAASLSSFRSCFCNRLLSSFSKYGRSSSNSSYESLIPVGPPARGAARGWQLSPCSYSGRFSFGCQLLLGTLLTTW